MYRKNNCFKSFKCFKKGLQITKIGDKVIKESSQVKLGDSIETTIKNGKIISRIEEII